MDQPGHMGQMLQTITRDPIWTPRQSALVKQSCAAWCKIEGVDNLKLGVQSLRSATFLAITNIKSFLLTHLSVPCRYTSIPLTTKWSMKEKNWHLTRDGAHRRKTTRKSHEIYPTRLWLRSYRMLRRRNKFCLPSWSEDLSVQNFSRPYISSKAPVKYESFNFLYGAAEWCLRCQHVVF